MQPRLARTDVGAFFFGVERGASGHVDNATPAARFHARQHRLRHEKRRTEIGVEHLAPQFRTDIEQRTGVADADVADRNIDATELLFGLAHHGQHLFMPGHIGHQPDRRHAERACLFYNGLHRGLVAMTIDHDISAGPGKRQHNGPADVAAGTGHDGSLAAQGFADFSSGRHGGLHQVESVVHSR